MEDRIFSRIKERSALADMLPELRRLGFMFHGDGAVADTVLRTALVKLHGQGILEQSPEHIRPLLLQIIVGQALARADRLADSAMLQNAPNALVARYWSLTMHKRIIASLVFVDDQSPEAVANLMGMDHRSLQRDYADIVALLAGAVDGVLSGDKV